MAPTTQTDDTNQNDTAAAHVFYLPHTELGTPEDDLRARIRFDGDVPTEDEFRDLYEYQGADETASMNTIFEKWNAGSRHESAAFARRECKDCDEVFDGVRDFSDRGERPAGARPENPVSLSHRESEVKKHEAETGHEVGRGHRSMMVGDIVLYDGDVHLCEPFNWGHVETLDALAAELVEEAEADGENEVSA